jgi:hypothetical protein
VLTSILQTAKQQDQNPFDVLVELLCSPDPEKILNLVPPRREVPQDGAPAPPLATAAGHRSRPPSGAEGARPRELVAYYVLPATVRSDPVAVQP